MTHWGSDDWTRHQDRKNRRTQEERRRKSSAKMLEAAATLFAEQGYDRTTLARIAEQAGYSSGLVALRFGSKADLVRALILDFRERSADQILKLELDKHDVLEGINRLVTLYFDAGLADKPLRAFFVLMAESAGPLRELSPLFTEHNRSLVALFESLLRKGQKTGAIRRSLNARTVATEIAGLLTGVTLMWLIDPAVVNPRRFFQEMRSHILQKLQS